MSHFQEKAGFIWQVADDILRGAFKQHEYGDVILPFVVLRRMDCVLKPTKKAVIAEYNKFKDKLQDLSPVLLKATKGLQFYNVSIYDLESMTQDAKNIGANFAQYTSGFSKNVRDILENFAIGMPDLIEQGYIDERIEKEIDLI